ncbi:peptidoglycan DD-metalloendopeptidase family protein [Streptomyces sp. NPDC018833]|uniref:peptidoglycan DD-metalloendopeptidase family protein n=1 Tax=Streptomyces sp. NPDC018833 TaxID=3365053 RepID=UPI00379893EA
MNWALWVDRLRRVLPVLLLTLLLSGSGAVPGAVAPPGAGPGSRLTGVPASRPAGVPAATGSGTAAYGRTATLPPGPVEPTASGGNRSVIGPAANEGNRAGVEHAANEGNRPLIGPTVDGDGRAGIGPVQPLLPASDAAGPGGRSGGRSWPVGPPRPTVVRGWAPPASPYGAGHRGVDIAAPPGTAVRAAAAGRVSFAGRVAGRGVLTISLTDTGDPPLRTTYEPVRPLVDVGATVTAGELVATVEGGPSHCAGGCLHWGLLRGSEYLDPLSLLPPWLLRRPPSRLLPVFGVPLPRSAPAAGAGP